MMCQVIDDLQIKIWSVYLLNSQGDSKEVKYVNWSNAYKMIKNIELISVDWSSGPGSAFDLLSNLWQIN